MATRPWHRWRARAVAVVRRARLTVAEVIAPEPEPESVSVPGGPPAEWLEKVRRGAPHLLEPGPATRGTAPMPPAPTIDTPPPRYLRGERSTGATSPDFASPALRPQLRPSGAGAESPRRDRTPVLRWSVRPAAPETPAPTFPAGAGATSEPSLPPSSPSSPALSSPAEPSWPSSPHPPPPALGRFRATSARRWPDAPEDPVAPAAARSRRAGVRLRWSATERQREPGVQYPEAPAPPMPPTRPVFARVGAVASSQPTWPHSTRNGEHRSDTAHPSFTTAPPPTEPGPTWPTAPSGGTADVSYPAAVQRWPDLPADEGDDPVAVVEERLARFDRAAWLRREHESGV